jgi:pyroglutamyl-peptidase
MTRLFAFEPFGGASVNASLEAARRWCERDDSLRLTVLPVVAGEAERLAAGALTEGLPALCLALGEATREPWEVRLERTYHNRDDFRIPDNAGMQRQGVPIEDGGPAVQYSTLELTGLGEDAPMPVRVSDDAGRFLCNRLGYFLSRSYPPLPSAFVHVPAWRPGDGEERLEMLVETLTRIKANALRR